MENNTKWLVYKHTNKINKKCYVGITCQTTQERWRQNGIGYKKSSPLFWSAIQKYGWDNFDHEILEDNIETKEEAGEREKYWIQYYNCCVLDGKDLGYNLDRGGCGMSPEMASILSKKNWEDPQYREIFCKPVICINTGEIYSSIVEASEKTNACKEVISRVCRGIGNTSGSDEQGNLLEWAFYEEGKEYKYSDPSILDKKNHRIICTTTGEIFNTVTEAANKYHISHSNISLCLTKKRNTAGISDKGEPLCWEDYIEGKSYKKKVGIKGKHRKVMCINTNKIYNSLKEAGLDIGVAPGNIGNCCKGKTKTAGVDKITKERLQWKYVDEEEEYDAD